MNRVLLHSCCAVCAAHPINQLQTSGYMPIVYFFNPKIYPEAEHDRRLKELVNYSEQNGYEYIAEDYSPKEWYDYIRGLEAEPEKGNRCEKCYEYRLEQTAQKAKELGINKISTTLTVSPHKDSKKIFEIADKIAQKYGINFMRDDFKKNGGFMKSMQIAKENDFYRQDYCGCEYSIKNKVEDQR